MDGRGGGDRKFYYPVKTPQTAQIFPQDSYVFSFQFPGPRGSLQMSLNGLSPSGVPGIYSYAVARPLELSKLAVLRLCRMVVSRRLLGDDLCSELNERVSP
jgi:hypothetical protein